MHPCRSRFTVLAAFDRGQPSNSSTQFDGTLVARNAALLQQVPEMANHDQILRSVDASHTHLAKSLPADTALPIVRHHHELNRKFHGHALSSVGRQSYPPRDKTTPFFIHAL